MISTKIHLKRKHRLLSCRHALQIQLISPTFFLQIKNKHSHSCCTPRRCVSGQVTNPDSWFKTAIWRSLQVIFHKSSEPYVWLYYKGHIFTVVSAIWWIISVKSKDKRMFFMFVKCSDTQPLSKFIMNLLAPGWISHVKTYKSP